jgi:hypothetical protein
MKKTKRKLPVWAKIFLFVAVGVVLWTAILVARQQAEQSCGSAVSGATNASPVIVHQPTISTQTIKWEIAQRSSPLTDADVTYIYQESQRYNIDDAFAVALWAEESQDGATSVPGTHNIGNVVISSSDQPYVKVYDPGSGVTHYFRVFKSWQESIDNWFNQAANSYVPQGFAVDLLTFALRYVDGLTQQQASAAQKDALQKGYVSAVQAIITETQRHEAQIHPDGGTNADSEDSAAPASTLASLIPNNLLPGWAGAGAVQAASLIPLNCTAMGGTSTGGGNLLVLAAMQLATHLAPDGSGSFDRWGSGTPSGVLSQSGITWCTDFVASAYQLAAHKSFTHYPNATNWLDNPAALQSDFVKVLAGPDSFPQAGDIAVLQDGGAGHVAIIVGVQLPQAGQSGWALVAQGHAVHVLEKWTLDANGTLTPPWPYHTSIPGYIRDPALAPTSANVAGKVQRIMQWPYTWDPNHNVGYDNAAQYYAYAASACSAASFTEVMRAWGINITIGQTIDEMGSDLSPTQGLYIKRGIWERIAGLHGFHAQVNGILDYPGRLSYNTILNTLKQGFPIIIGMQGQGWSHFLVVVSGDSTGVHIVDSSRWNMTFLPRGFFSGSWVNPTPVIDSPVTWTGESIIISHS